MVEMPRRPRQHVLESEARRAFRELIEPLGWVVREVDTPDYGVDDEVEVFEDELATGLKFFVQSKGTDNAESSAITMRLTTAQQNYLGRLELPVLLVRYHSRSKRTYVQWFHRVDPFPRPPSQTIHFDPDSQLTPETVPGLAAETRAFHSWKAITLRWPIQLRIRSDTSCHDQRDLELEVFRVIGDNTAIVVGRASLRDDQPRLEVTVSSDLVRVDGAVASHTMHGERDWVNDVERGVVANRIIFGAAMVLGDLGFGGRAAPLLESVLCAEYVPAEIAERAGAYFARAGRADCALRVAEYWLERASAAFELAPPLLILAAAASGLGHGEKDQLRAAAETLQRIGAASRRLGAEDHDIAAAFLAAARCWFELGDWQRADTFFTRAMSLDTSLRTGGRHLAEAAGAAHEAADYEKAITLINDAITLCPDDANLVARRADSLLQLGQLTRAAAEFEQYFARQNPIATMWHLKHAMVQFLLASGRKDGPRDPDTADHLLADRQFGESSDTTRRRCFAALAADSLHAGAWAELGTIELKANRASRAAAPLLIAALADRRTETWVPAVAAAVRGGLDEIATRIASVALYDFGEQFHLDLRSWVAATPDGSAIVAFVEETDRANGRERRSEPRR